ncbi:unnamed protein product [Arabis nemorensis]|uniref:PGG domain-containing protein n=1 Tax=Arabis nemorensis TaxID=586526 RepID=A0A565CHT1_9BRAS|nr:unnamed protein product [Arabis nemorensis]
MFEKKIDSTKSDFSPALEQMTELDEYDAYLSLSQAISNDDLEGLKDSLDQLRNADAWTYAFEKSLQKACSCGKLGIVKELLRELMRPYHMSNERLKVTLSSALDIAAGNGNSEIVKELYDYYTEQHVHLGRYELVTPLLRASEAGHRDTIHYLYDNNKPPFDVLKANQGYWGIYLLLDVIFYGFLDIAVAIVDEFPPLAVTKHPGQSSSPLKILATKPEFFRSHCDLGFWGRLIYSCVDFDFPADSETSKPNLFQRIKKIEELKERHSQAHKLLQKMCKAVQVMFKDESWKATVHEALLEAVENGNEEFFTEIIKHNPRLLWISEANSRRNLFQLAVKFRKEKIFNLIYGLDDRKVKLLRSCDQNNNNILHIVAYLSPRPDHLSKISGSALKMQRAIQWYGEVRSLVSELEVIQKNNEGKTPRQVFEESHEPLRKQGEEWMKYTATACSFVAALIATVTFQAIFTVPGGTDETSGKPLLLRDLHFTAFIMSDALAFFTSCTSVLIFLSILTARYSFDDFIVSLPRKMILGLAILFFSIASMLVAFITALSSSMRQRPSLVVPMKPLASLPGLLFLMLQYPLLKEMISSTYGKGLFHRNKKSWFLVPKETQVHHVASSSEGSQNH